MKLLNCLMAAASLSALAACATTTQTVVQTPEQPAVQISDNAGLYGLFLAGRKAIDENQGREATEYFARASTSEPDAIFLKEAAFDAALDAGEVHRAAMLAPGADEASLSGQRLGKLTRAVDDMAQGDARAAQAVLGPEPLGPPHRVAGALLLPWAAAAAGDWKTALTLPDTRGDPLVSDVAKVDQAMLYEHTHRYADAEAVYKALLADNGGASIDAISYGQFLERRGRRDEAKAVYLAALKADPNNALIQMSRDRVVAGGAAPAVPTFNQGAAQALLAPAAAALAERQNQFGLRYLQLVVRLDPDRDEVWILLGDSQIEVGNVEAARAAYEHPKPGSPEYIVARGRLILTYQEPEDAPKALAIAQDTAKALPNNDDALALLADSLRVSEQYAESAKVLDTLIAHQGAHASWQLYYMRGVALAESDRWTEAQQDLEKALALKPDDPELLNYLAYSWVDRGERLKEARAMIEKAAQAKPDSGAILDSLGWADFKLGDYKGAAQQLERAATLEAADPDINDHLGDAYWKVGRRTEARFQWDKVLTLDPSAKLREQVQMKLKSGLDGPTPASLPA